MCVLSLALPFGAGWLIVGSRPSPPGATTAPRTSSHSPPSSQRPSGSRRQAGPDAVRIGFGQAAVQGDGGTGDSRPRTPDRSEPGNSEPGNDDDGNEIDSAEDNDVAVPRNQQRPAHGDDIENDDQEAVSDPDAVGKVVRGKRHADRAADHRREQD